jgi:protocatechuate 3,4-dioxygenase beta subunit
VPAHIHPLIKEPNKNEYYIDEYLFNDDPSLTTAERKRQENRGGNGIIKLGTLNGMLVGKRDIILGLNIPDYPVNRNK